MSDPRLSSQSLTTIPLVSAGADWVLDILEQRPDLTHTLLDESAGRYPAFALKIGDAVSRRWLEKSGNPYLTEIAAVSERIKRPGAYFLNVSYEWGCTSGAGPDPKGQSARLVRVLDWPDHGLGRNVLAARIENPLGEWLSLTWPGYTGVLQAMAPGRFAAALNQAPMDRPVGLLPFDWMVNRKKVWRSKALTPAHLLRQVFETARDFHEARKILTQTPISSPAIYILSGIKPEESCVIERRECEAFVIEGAACAANQWQNKEWLGQGRGRGVENCCRLSQMRGFSREMQEDFDWLTPPILNETTRLALIADAASGTLIARGYEKEGPATEIFKFHS